MTRTLPREGPASPQMLVPWGVLELVSVDTEGRLCMVAAWLSLPPAATAHWLEEEPVAGVRCGWHGGPEIYLS